ncbi:MAG: hypothetical protein L7H03_02440 [Vulcanisaeta sp.]|nr:hypothetical protein [Vulcanisaeta sp.]MDT7863078.1 hypothetical protein [Vulcanisaeta sp.]
MRQYALVIIYASNDEVKELANRKLGDVGLEITSGVMITWHARQDLEGRIMSIKDELVKIMEGGFEGEFAYAIVELTDEQFRAVRPLVVRRLEVEDKRLLTYGENLLKRMRSRLNNRVRREYGRFDRQYRRLIMLHNIFDVKHELLNRVMDLARELRIEYERRHKEN